MATAALLDTDRKEQIPKKTVTERLRALEVTPPPGFSSWDTPRVFEIFERLLALKEKANDPSDDARK